GVATVTGTMESEQLIGRTIGLAYKQKGVKSVKNDRAINAVKVPSNRPSIVSHVSLQHYDSQPLNFLVEDYAVFFPVSLRRCRAA
ncbi:MAG: hypothetical protein ACU836_18340, partial [Gammaproteobacteria bacterium]